MKARITITLTVLTDGTLDDVEALASQLEQGIDEFNYIFDDLEDDNPVINPCEAEYEVIS